MIEIDLNNIKKNELATLLIEKDKEIKRLKEEYMILQNASDKVEEEKDREIERLNNIINELGKWTEKQRDKWEKYNPISFVYYQSILDRMKELKGVDKE